MEVEPRATGGWPRWRNESGVSQEIVQKAALAVWNSLDTCEWDEASPAIQGLQLHAAEIAIATALQAQQEKLEEAVQKLPRFDCEEEEGTDYYRTPSAVMVEYDDGTNGDWLRRSDVLAALAPFLDEETDRG